MTAAMAKLAAWWVSELVGLFPERLREALRRRGRRLLIELDGQRARFLLCEGGEAQEIAALDLAAEPLARPELGEEVRKACDGRVSEIAVRVASRQALRRNITLPLAAERNLSAVLAFEMDRYTPFKSDLVYYDFAVLGRHAEKRELELALTLVARKDVDPLLAALRGWGLEATSLGVDGEQPCNLLPAAQAGGRQAGASRPARALAVLALLLALTALVLPFAYKVPTIAALEKELEQAREQAARAEQVRKELKQLASEENTLVERRKERPAAIEVVHELTQLLPDSAWLSHLELAGSRLRIRGESPNAAELATSIENSPMLRGASIDGSVTRDPKTDRERFAISATAHRAGEQ